MQYDKRRHMSRVLRHQKAQAEAARLYTKEETKLAKKKLCLYALVVRRADKDKVRGWITQIENNEDDEAALAHVSWDNATSDVYPISDLKVVGHVGLPLKPKIALRDPAWNPDRKPRRPHHDYSLSQMPAITFKEGKYK